MLDKLLLWSSSCVKVWITVGVGLWITLAFPLLCRRCCCCRRFDVWSIYLNAPLVKTSVTKQNSILLCQLIDVFMCVCVFAFHRWLFYLRQIHAWTEHFPENVCVCMWCGLAQYFDGLLLYVNGTTRPRFCCVPCDWFGDVIFWRKFI